MERTVEMKGRRDVAASTITIALAFECEDEGPLKGPAEPKNPVGTYTVKSGVGAVIAHGRWKTGRDGYGYCLTFVPFELVPDQVRETAIATVNAMLLEPRE